MPPVSLQSDRKPSFNKDIQEVTIAPSIEEKPLKEEKKLKTPETKIDTALLNSISRFATNVLDHMLNDKVVATPENYEIYFAKLLEGEESELKGYIASMESGEKISAQTRVQMETDIRHGFVQIKNILQIITVIYKNLLVMEGIVKKRMEESKNDANAFEIQSCIKAFNEDLLKLNALIARHVEAIKTSYDEIGRVFKSISNQSVYDTQYAVFNKRYFIAIIKNNLEYVKKYGYSETLMLTQVDPKVLASIDSINDKRGILRNIAQTLFNISRRSDIVAHYENGCFGVLMQHTDIEGGKKACERIRRLLGQAKFFISESELNLQIQIVLAPLKADLSAEELISSALDGLEKSSGKDYFIVD